MVFGDGEDGTRHGGVVAHEAVLRVKQVEAVFVGAHPEVSPAVSEHARHAVVAYYVGRAQPGSHVAEARFGSRLHEHTLLKHAQPRVAVAVFGDGIDLGVIQLGVPAVIGVGGEPAVVWFVDVDSGSVASQHQPVGSVGIELGDGQPAGCGSAFKLSCVGIQPPQSLSEGPHPNVALPVGADVAQRMAHGLVGKIVACHLTTVQTVEAAVAGDGP